MFIYPIKNKGQTGRVLQSVSTGSSSRRRLILICSGGRAIATTINRIELNQIKSESGRKSPDMYCLYVDCLERRFSEVGSHVAPTHPPFINT